MTLTAAAAPFTRAQTRIVLLEGVSARAAELFTRAGYTNVTRHPKALDGAALADAVVGAHIVGIRSRTQLTRDVMLAAGPLMGVGCFCIGTDQVELEAARDLGVPVFNAPFSNTRSVAELTIGEIVMLLRRITPRSVAAHAGDWDKSAEGSFEVRGKTLGIVGYGNIGTQLSTLAEACGMRVIYFDRNDKLRHGNTEPVASLAEAIEEASALLKAAKRPMILADVEIHRFGLQDDLIALAEGAGLPIATTILGKSVISEGHPLFVGVYEGAMGRAEVADRVEEADCLLMLGCFLTDINLGIFTAKLDTSKCIDATSEDLRIRHHHYKEVRLDDFIRGLHARNLSLAKPLVPPRASTLNTPRVTNPDASMTVARLFARLNRMLDDKMVVIADIGDSLFGSADLHMTRRTDFISPAYYTSMGFAVPASVGAGMANRDHRSLVIVGDGAFQMTGMELSTIARQGLNPIVVVLNNHGYTTERFILEGSFNDIHDWKFHKIPEVLGAGIGIEVRTEGELDSAIDRALANTSSFSLLNVHLDPMDRSPALERLATRLAGQI